MFAGYDDYSLAILIAIALGLEYEQQRRARNTSKRRRLLARRDRVPRSAILPTCLSPVRYLLSSRSDGAYIRYFGLDVSTFEVLLDPFDSILALNALSQ